jgi:hypothetical protein
MALVYRVGAYSSNRGTLEGHNPAASTSFVGLNEYNQNIIWDSILAAAAQVDVTSSSTNDAAAGTGARTVELIGVDANYLVISETLTLNGQTIVTSALSYLRLTEINVLTTGSGRVNAGDLHAVKTGTGGSYTTGVPGTLTSALVKVPAGYNRSFSSVFIIPATKVAGKIVSASFGSGAQGATFKIFTRDLTDATAPLVEAFSQPIGANSAYAPKFFDNIANFPAKTQVELKVIGWAASANAFAKVILDMQ